MKSTTFMALMAVVLVLSCQKTSRNTDERTLNLTAPSGQQIAKSFDQLKSTSAAVLQSRLGIRQSFIITSIDYLPVPEGYAAVLNYQLDNGQTGSMGMLSVNNLKSLTPAANSGVVYENADANASVAYLVCTGTCQCRAYLAYNRRTGELTKSCGCEECTGEVTFH